jgi:hypothetical protein
MTQIYSLLWSDSNEKIFRPPAPMLPPGIHPHRGAVIVARAKTRQACAIELQTAKEALPCFHN